MLYTEKIIELSAHISEKHCVAMSENVRYVYQGA